MYVLQYVQYPHAGESEGEVSTMNDYCLQFRYAGINRDD